MKRLGSILWGIVFIGIGIIWGLNSLGITDINIFFDGWWTLFIIIPCLVGAIKDENKTGDVIGLLIGIALLLCAQDILSFSLIIKLAFPVIFILIGLGMIFGNIVNQTLNKKIKELNANKLEAFTSTFGSQKADFTNQEFKGANLDAVFGSVDLLLKDANITTDQVINASAIFGGIDIYIPEHVNVRIKSIPIFGGVTNKKDSNKNKENIPTLYVNAFCLFGGVTIK